MKLYSLSQNLYAAVEIKERTYRQTDKQAYGVTSYFKMGQFLRNVEKAIKGEDTVQ
jgi:hypothetical protein